MRKFLSAVAFSTVILVGCTSAEEKAYTEAYEKAQTAIEASEWNDATTYLKEAVASGFEESAEAAQLLNEIQLFNELQVAMQAGDIEAAQQKLANLQAIEQPLPAIETQLREIEDVINEKLVAYEQLNVTITEAQTLMAAKNYEGAQVLLAEVKAENYSDAYFQPLLQKVDEKQAEITKALAEMAARAEEQRIAEEKRKAEAKRVAEEEARKKANNFNYKSDAEVITFISNYLNVSEDVMLVWADTDENGIRRFEIRHDNTKVPGADPNVAPSLGFFHIGKDGNLYKMDVVTASDVKIN